METEGYEVPITEQALRTIKQYAKGYTVVPIPAREEEPLHWKGHLSSG